MKKNYSENIAFKVFSAVDSSASIAKDWMPLQEPIKQTGFEKKKIVCMSKQVRKKKI